jgi:hypothetical protein
VACIDLCCGRDRVRLFTVFRQPTYDATSVAYITQLTECFTKFANCKRPCYIVGDLYCPAIDWSFYTAPTDNVQDALLNALKNSFVQMITDCTHGTNVLDTVLTNKPITLVDSKVLAPFANSDHCQVSFIIACEKSSVSVCEIPVENTFYSWQDADFISMEHFLSCVDWYQLLTVNLTANDLWSALQLFCNKL